MHPGMYLGGKQTKYSLSNSFFSWDGGEKNQMIQKICQLFNVKRRLKLCKKRTLFLEVGPGGLRDEC